MAYRELLEFAKNNSALIKLHGGSIPKTYVRDYMQTGDEM